MHMLYRDAKMLEAVSESLDLWLELAEAVGAVLNDAECIPLSDRVSVYESAMDKLYVTLNKLKGQQ